MNRDMDFWWRWLVVVTIGVALFGLSMVVAPGFIRGFFSALLYGSAAAVSGFGEPAVAYISLVHGVLGAVMFGWGVALLLVLFGPFRRGSADGWWIVTVSIAAWFVPDTVFSLWTGFWPNALLNAVFAIAFAVPLAATYRGVRRAGGAAPPGRPSYATDEQR